MNIRGLRVDKVGLTSCTGIICTKTLVLAFGGFSGVGNVSGLSVLGRDLCTSGSVIFGEV